MRPEVGPAKAAWPVAEGRSVAPKSETRSVPAVCSHKGKPLAEEAALLSARAGRSQLSATYAKFSVDDRTHEVTVRIIDAATGEVLRFIPPWNRDEAASALDRTLESIVVDPTAALRAHSLVTAEATQRLTQD